jgi:hypothetical protein
MTIRRWAISDKSCDEGFAIDEAVDNAWLRGRVVVQGGKEGAALPVTMRDVAVQALTAGGAAMKPHHAGLHPRVIDEDKLAGSKSAWLRFQDCPATSGVKM